MLTPQDIQEIAFARAVVGGYDMGAVDEFLEQVEADYESIYRENQSLRGEINSLSKMIKEYQNREASLLESAKKERDRIIREAQVNNSKSNDDEEQAKKTLIELNSKIEDEKRRLASLCADTDQYIAAIHRLMERQTDYLNSLRNVTVDVRKKNSPLPPAKPPVKKSDKKLVQPIIIPEIDLDDREDSATAEEINDFVSKIMNDMKPVEEPEPTMVAANNKSKKIKSSAAKGRSADDMFDFKNMKFKK